MELEYLFLDRDQIDEVHDLQLRHFGGIAGIRDESGLESAIAQPVNVYLYGNGDVFDIAAAYAFHIAASQAFLDGNKRTGAQAALAFLELNGVTASNLPEAEAYEAMMRIARHEWDRHQLAAFLRTSLA